MPAWSAKRSRPADRGAADAPWASRHDRLRLSHRLRRVLSDNPHARAFSVDEIVQALGPEAAGPPIALFAGAGVLGAPDAAALAGGVTSALGAGLALGRGVRLPRALLRRKVSRTSLALLIHSIAGMLEAADGVLRERWSWVFHPVMTGTLGTILFLLGLVSMAPIVGGGVQHAASAFFIAVGLAERDGLAVVLGALAGLAGLAWAALGVSSGRKLWAKVKAWLLEFARKLRLDALAHMLDHCCEGLGELVRLRWSGILLVLLAPAGTDPRRPPRRDSARGANSPLRERARRARMAAQRATG